MTPLRSDVEVGTDILVVHSPGLCLGSLWPIGEEGHNFMAVGTGWRSCLPTALLAVAVHAR